MTLLGVTVDRVGLCRAFVMLCAAGLVLTPAGVKAGAPRGPTPSGAVGVVGSACRALRVSCVEDCSRRPAGSRGTAYAPLGVFEGAFTAAGRREAVVGLFPCGAALGLEGARGLGVLLALGDKGWSSRSSENGVVLPASSCRVENAGRDVVVCRVDWGPFQGVSGQSACVTRWADTRLKTECPVRLTAQDESPEGSQEFSRLGVRALANGHLAFEVRIGDRRLEFTASGQTMTVNRETAEQLAGRPIVGLEIDASATGPNP